MRSSACRSALTLLAPALIAWMLTGCGSGISLDEPIEGPTWRLVQLADQPIATGNEPQRDAQIQFDAASGRVSGSGGCNRLSGTFQRSGYSLRRLLGIVATDVSHDRLPRSLQKLLPKLSN